eukprot:scaffold70974_cov63-Phaeocystis_antarctica.AAC.2
MVRGRQGDDSSRARGAPSPPVMAVASATAPEWSPGTGRPRPSGGTQAQRTAEEMCVRVKGGEGVEGWRLACSCSSVVAGAGVAASPACSSTAAPALPRLFRPLPPATGKAIRRA